MTTDADARSGADDPRVAKATETLGACGRLISISKTRFRDRDPDHVAVFNARVVDCAGRRLWFGDLDLTVDEPKLVELAQRMGEPVFVLHEGAEHPAERTLRVDRAVLSVTPDGHSRYLTQWHERGRTGAPRRRPPNPAWMRRRVWAPRRPRLWRFWKITTETYAIGPQPGDLARSLRIGDHPTEHPVRPHLELRYETSRQHGQAVNISWIPAATVAQLAGRPLINRRFRIRRGPLRSTINLVGQQGLLWAVQIETTRHARRSKKHSGPDSV